MDDTVEFDKQQSRWSIRSHRPLPAGWCEVALSGMAFRFDRSEIGDLVALVLDAEVPSPEHRASAEAVFGRAVRDWLEGGRPPQEVTVRSEAIQALSRLALAHAVRGQAPGWHNEIAWLDAEARESAHLNATPAARASRVLPWLDLEAGPPPRPVKPPRLPKPLKLRRGRATDEGTGTGQDLPGPKTEEPAGSGAPGTADEAVRAARAAGTDACDAERFALFDEAQDLWSECAQWWRLAVDRAGPEGAAGLDATQLGDNLAAARTVDVVERIWSGSAGGLLLTEHRGRLRRPRPFTVTRGEEGSVHLVGQPAGPAGTTTIAISDVTLTVDTAEPTRVVEATFDEDPFGGGPAPRAPARAVGPALPLAVVARDVEVLGAAASSDDDLLRLAAAEYELALGLHLLGEVDAARAAGRPADSILQVLRKRPPPIVEELRLELNGLLGPLLTPAGPGLYLGGTGVDEKPATTRVPRSGTTMTDLRAIELDRERWTAQVFADVAARLGLVQPEVTFDLIEGPVGRVHIDAAPAEAVVVHVTLLRRRHRVGETTATVTGPLVVSMPTLAAPDEVSVDIVDADPGAGRRLGREAVAAELTRDVVGARSTWLEASLCYLAGDQPDRAAIALAERARLMPSCSAEELTRIALLGSRWALLRGPVEAATTRRWQVGLWGGHRTG